MRKIFIASAIAVTLTVPFITGLLNIPGEGFSNSEACAAQQAEEPSGRIITDEEAGKVEEVQRADEKRLKEAKRDAEEARRIIVARVNGVDITMFMLVRAMNRIAPQHVKKGDEATPEMTEQIKQDALDMLILEELAVQQAIKEGIIPAAEEIEKVMSQIRESLGSEQAYQAYLDKSLLTEDMLKKLIERSRRYELITAREVYGKVIMDEKLLREEYEREKERFILPDNFLVEDVFFLNKDEDAARAKSYEVLKLIKKKNNDVWKLVLDGTFIVRKIRISEERYPEIYKTMRDMNVGDLSDVIKEADGFHIIKVVKKEHSRQATFEEAKPALEPKFLVLAQDQRKKEWEKELRKGARIEILLEEQQKK